MKILTNAKSKSILIVLFVAICSALLVAEPTIAFKTDEIDFGEIESGKVVQIKFEFENVGDSPLIIKNVSSSCGCTAAKLEKKEYKPGEKGIIPTKFFSQGYSGRIIKTLTVTTDDPKHKHNILKIKGEVKLTQFAKIELTPDKIDFKKVDLGVEYTQKIIIKNPGTIDLRIVEVIHSPEISTRFSNKVIQAGESGEINIVFRPMAPGAFSSFLKIRTNAYKRPMSLIKVTGQVQGESAKAPSGDTAVDDH